MKKIVFLTLLAPLFLLSACNYYPDDFVEAESQLIAVTQMDENFVDSLHSHPTFAIVDSITYISVLGSNSYTNQRQLSSFDQQALDKITQNMEARGFRLAGDGETPSLVINVTSVTNTYVSESYYGWWYDYWDYYWPWYDFWPDYYPYYYPAYYPVYYSSYSAQTLVIELGALNSTQTQLVNHWYGLVRGISIASHSDSEKLAYIDQCFKQTPELKY